MMPLPEELTFTITMTTAGGVNVRGPLQNKMLCYGMLELARDVVTNYKPAETPGLLVAHALPGGKAP